MPAKNYLAFRAFRGWPLDAVAEVGVALPWVLFSWLNYALACHRWAGWQFALSISVSGIAAVLGWHLGRCAAARFDDAHIGDLLVHVEDASAWALFPHPAQIIKREHAAWCHHRWGVTPRTSGWVLFRRSWRAETWRALGCLALVVHAWWTAL